MNYAALQASDGSGEAIRATVQSPGRDVGSTTIPVDAVTNYPTGTGACIITTGTLQPNNTITNAQVMYGTASGTSITITAFAAGYSDLGNSVGDVVVIKPTTEWANTVGKHIANITGNGTPEPATVSTLAASGLISANGGLSLSGTSIGTWQSWTPTFGNLTIGNATVSGSYMQIGKSVWWNLSVTLGNTSSMGTNPTFSLPTTVGHAPANNNSFTLGTGAIVVSGGGGVIYARAQYSSSTVAELAWEEVSGSAVVFGGISSTTPFTWADGSCIDLQGFYQSA